MTKKDYELVAQVIKDIRNLCILHKTDPAIPRIVAQTFADRLAQTNPRFDRATFLRACGCGS